MIIKYYILISRNLQVSLGHKREKKQEKLSVFLEQININLHLFRHHSSEHMKASVEELSVNLTKWGIAGYQPSLVLWHWVSQSAFLCWPPHMSSIYLSITLSACLFSDSGLWFLINRLIESSKDTLSFYHPVFKPIKSYIR